MNRNHLKMFSNKQLYGKDYVRHIEISNLIDNLSLLVVFILTGMLLLIIFSNILMKNPPSEKVFVPEKEKKIK